MRSRYVPLSLCLSLRFLPPRLFLLPKRHLRNQFRCRPAALSVSLSGDTADEFFLPRARARASLLSSSSSSSASLLSFSPKFRNVITLSPKRFSLSLSRTSAKSPASISFGGGDGGCWLRELLYEFRHARRRDALPAGSAFVFVAQGPVAPSFLKQYNLRNLVGDEHTLFSSLLPCLRYFPSRRVGLNRRDRRCIDEFQHSLLQKRRSSNSRAFDLSQKSWLVYCRGLLTRVRRDKLEMKSYRD